jgi:hypothetical protein
MHEGYDDTAVLEVEAEEFAYHVESRLAGVVSIVASAFLLMA